MSKNSRIIGLALVNSFLAFLCGASFGPWLPLLSGASNPPGNFLIVFFLLLGLTVFIMVVRGGWGDA